MDGTRQNNWPLGSKGWNSYPARLALYGVGSFCLFQCVYLGVHRFSAATMAAENGPVEAGQVCLASLSAICFFLAARIACSAKAALVACGAITCYATARELDSFLEYHLFDDAYKWIAGFPMLLLVTVVVYRQRGRILSESLAAFRHPGATIFVVGGVLLGSLCQMMDRPGLWLEITDANQAATIKSLAEESCELFAYYLFAAAGFESIAFARESQAANSITGEDSLGNSSQDASELRIAA